MDIKTQLFDVFKRIFDNVNSYLTATTHQGITDIGSSAKKKKCESLQAGAEHDVTLPFTFLCRTGRVVYGKNTARSASPCSTKKTITINTYQSEDEDK
ncbi:hypothetical protein E2C01_002463 [Portunus trituberculatus]|uniref:Uncharacterized protein n=1 Tax=Portunus trituberculatus TaxID=210409 RepID=A0A5B7CNB5_PORTR|nr:hypothetical protein [Portunus trituberculatus]